MMRRIHQFFAARRTAIGAVLVSLVLYVAGVGEAAAFLHDTFNVPPHWAVRTVNLLKLLAVVLAALGYSPLPAPGGQARRLADRLPNAKTDDESGD